MPTLLINSLRSWYRSNGDGDERRRIWKDLPAVGGFVFDLEHVCRSVPTTEHSGLSQASRRNPVVLCLTQKHSPKHPRPQSLSLTYSSSKRLLPGLASSSAASIFPSLHWNLAKVYITSFIFRAVMVLTQTDGPAWSFLSRTVLSLRSDCHWVQNLKLKLPCFHGICWVCKRLKNDQSLHYSSI